MAKLTKVAVAIGPVLVVGVLAACSDATSVIDPVTADTVIASDAQPNAASTLRATRGESSALATIGAATEATDFTYVSLRRGTLPNGVAATISNRRLGSSLTQFLTDGGFDPVALPGRAGDELEMQVTDASDAIVYTAIILVPIKRPPQVVRTAPLRGKKDVPLNVRIVVVFTEPIDGTTLTRTSIRLLGGTTAIAGSARFLDPSLDATHVMVEFVPDVPLAGGTEYQLTVSGDVRDRSGQPLASPETVTFTTGNAVAGPPASIQVSPDSMLDLVVGASYQLTATVQDAAGNMLTDQPVTWSIDSEQAEGLTVSSTGLLAALKEYWYRVNATVGTVTKGLTVHVIAAPPASITVSPAPATVSAGDTIFVAAVVRDAAGRVSNTPSVTWTSSAPTIATIVPYETYDVVGLAYAIVTGVSQGSVTLTATSGAVNGTTPLTVTAPLPVASVTVTPSSPTVIAQTSVQLSAILKDGNGKVMAARPITWTSDNAAVASVDANGLVTAATVGSASVTAASGGASAAAAITVVTLTFASVSTGMGHTCALTTNGVAYCWGSNPYGELGSGSSGFESSSLTPVKVIGGLTFTALSVGSHTCGLIASGAAYCWGSNYGGQLGNGSSGNGSFSSVPVAVTGGLTFTAVSVGSGYTCGLASGGAVYCWGLNNAGVLGVGTTTGPETCTYSAFPCSTKPVQVLAPAGLTFTAVSAGFRTCAVSAGDAAYCWGSRVLGDGTANDSPVPVAVTGGLKFVSVTKGGWATCGLTPTAAAYCWGSDVLGDGSEKPSLVPVAVTGGLAFTTLSTGYRHTCGVATGGSAYCWGVGGLGDGSSGFSLVPVAVTGGLTFTSVSSGNAYTCGVTTGAVAYCWGNNGDGQLGNGSTISSLVPVKVAGQP